MDFSRRPFVRERNGRMQSAKKLWYAWRFRNVNLQTAEPFRIQGTHPGKCVRVIDGDTFDIVFEFNNKINAFRVRLAGCDTPELHPHHMSGEEKIAHQKLAENAKLFVDHLILNKIVTIAVHPKENDKFGRVLAYVKIGCGCDLTDILLATKRALPFQGKEKKSAEFEQPDLTIKTCKCGRTKFSFTDR